jgi:acyl-coenzyme A thioesterase PaaI-like protein
MMRPINNPFLKGHDYDCFGCAPHNPIGLGLEFFEDGEEVISEWKPREHFEGFKGVLHGGIQAALHDEIASWVVFVKLGTAGYTQNLSLTYLAPVMVAKGPITLRSKLRDMDGNKATMVTTLFDGEGKACSESLAVYFTVPVHIAKRMFDYPGKEAFLETM